MKRRIKFALWSIVIWALHKWGESVPSQPPKGGAR